MLEPELVYIIIQMVESLINPQMVKQFSNPDEPVLFHCSISKLSRYNFNQKRTLIVTTEHIYVFEDTKINRKHKITNIGAIIKSLKSSEMVL